MKVRPRMISATISRRAITFIELLIVIVIIGILTGVSIPQFRKTFSHLELESFVKDIYYLSRYLQGSAVSQGKIYCLNIDKEPEGFHATYKKESDFLNAEGRFGKLYKFPDGISVSVDPPDINNIYFYPDGSIDKIKITFKNRYEEICLVIKGTIGEIQIH